MVLGQLFCKLGYPYTLCSCVIFLLLRWLSFWWEQMKMQV